MRIKVACTPCSCLLSHWGQLDWRMDGCGHNGWDPHGQVEHKSWHWSPHNTLDAAANKMTRDSHSLWRLRCTKLHLVQWLMMAIRMKYGAIIEGKYSQDLTKHNICSILSLLYSWTIYWQHYRADSRFAPSQWEMALLCNNVSYWLGANLESALHYIFTYHLTYKWHYGQEIYLSLYIMDYVVNESNCWWV